MNIQTELEKLGKEKTGKAIGESVRYRSSWSGIVNGVIKAFGVTCLTVSTADGDDETIPYETFAAKVC